LSREDYVAIATRLVAIYIIFQLSVQAPMAIQYLAQGQPAGSAWPYAVAFVACLALCAFLWFFPLTVARKLLPAMKEPRSEQSISAPVGLSLGLTLIGVWIFARGLVDAVYWLTLIVRMRQLNQEMGFVWPADQTASIVTTVFELVLGAWLVLGNAGLRRVIYKLRYGNLQ
jgi:hypothetical protein